MGKNMNFKATELTNPSLLMFFLLSAYEKLLVLLDPQNKTKIDVDLRNWARKSKFEKRQEVMASENTFISSFLQWNIQGENVIKPSIVSNLPRGTQNAIFHTKLETPRGIQLRFSSINTFNLVDEM